MGALQLLYTIFKGLIEVIFILIVIVLAICVTIIAIPVGIVTVIVGSIMLLIGHIWIAGKGEYMFPKRIKGMPKIIQRVVKMNIEIPKKKPKKKKESSEKKVD